VRPAGATRALHELHGLRQLVDATTADDNVPAEGAELGGDRLADAGAGAADRDHAPSTRIPFVAHWITPSTRAT
jgi:hypothetical protein